MRISTLTIALSSVLLLASCGRNSGGPLAALERNYGPMPAGYAKPYEVPVPPPVVTETKKVPVYTAAPVPVVVATPLPPPAEAGEELVWNRISAYDAATPSLPAKEASAAPAKKLSVPVLYEDVTVFPVDGDTAPYEDMTYDFTRTAANMPVPLVSPIPDRMAQQVFFGYGSAKVESADRQRLEKLAANVGRSGRAYAVNVIGHASKRVDHVMDPVRRKMINFVMAQKRASAVTRELNAAGLSPDWVMAASRGDEMPNPNPGHRTQEAADRRVDVYVDTHSYR